MSRYFPYTCPAKFLTSIFDRLETQAREKARVDAVKNVRSRLTLYQWTRNKCESRNPRLSALLSRLSKRGESMRNANDRGAYCVASTRMTFAG